MFRCQTDLILAGSLKHLQAFKLNVTSRKVRTVIPPVTFKALLSERNIAGCYMLRPLL